MYSARLKIPKNFREVEARALSCALEDHVMSCALVRENRNMNAPWVLELFTPDKPNIETLCSILKESSNLNIAPDAWEITPVSNDIDWLERCYEEFQPFSVGPFFIYGSHFDSTVPDGQIGLQIDAATAFGSGEHGTTKGCLQAMLDMKGMGVCPWNILDMGTGSGILAIAAWKLWKTPILAVDIDDECVHVTQRHMNFNQVPDQKTAVTCAQSDGFDDELVQRKKPYELIIANILASTLKDMTDDIAAVIDTNGYVILSGILEDQAQYTLDLYEKRNLVLKKRYDIAGWSTLVLHNAAT